MAADEQQQRRHFFIAAASLSLSIVASPSLSPSVAPPLSRACCFGWQLLLPPFGATFSSALREAVQPGLLARSEGSRASP